MRKLLAFVPILLIMALCTNADSRPAAPHAHAEPIEQITAMTATPTMAALRVPCTGLPCQFEVTVVDTAGQDGLTPTVPPAPTATLAPSPTPSATASLLLTPTATIAPSPTILPSPTVGPSAMIEGVPVCTGHDPLHWHGLVERNADTSIRCAWGHEHHDNPDSVNDIFGAPGAWFGAVAQSISYPWQTFAFPNPQPDNYPLPVSGDPLLLENAAKHNGYKWYVKRDLPCIPQAPSPNDGCFRAWRVQVHSLGTIADTTVRFHSFSMEALVDYHGQQGIVRGGGWMDTGFLGLGVDGGAGIVCPPLATNPPSFWHCPSSSSGTLREASSLNPPAPHTAHGNPGAPTNWYATHRNGVAAGPMVEDFGPVDYTNPSQQHFWPPAYRANNSQGNIENMVTETRYDWLGPYWGVDGRINARVWQNRHGELATNCSTASVDCVPFVVEGATAALYQMNRNANQAVFNHGDHDVLSPVTGNSLIQYPN